MPRRELRSDCPRCAAEGEKGKIVDAESVYGSSSGHAFGRRPAPRPVTGTHYRCDRGHDWEEPPSSPKAAEPTETAKCPKCGKVAPSDLRAGKWPPTKNGLKLTVNYRCPEGHEFSVVRDLR